MKTNIIKTMAAAMAALAMAACSDVEIPQADTSAYPAVSGLSMTQDGRNVTLEWTNPQAENLLGVRVDKNGTSIATLDAPVSTYLARHIEKNIDVFFTVKARYADGTVSEGQTVMARFDGDVTPPAMLLPQADEATLDDDEKAALDWFRGAYPEGRVLTPADMAAGDITPDQYGEIWVQVDRVGLTQGWQNLPSELVQDDVIAALREYVLNGGNLLLTKHATQLVAAIGRVAENRAPNLFGSGAGGEGTDIWTLNPVIGSDQSEPYDHSSHAIYAGLEVIPESVTGYPDGYGLEGPGFREDHNCMWDCNNTALEISNTPNVIKGFEEATNSSVLATWAHVRDYCCAGIVDFNPDGDYLGRIVAIGLNSYEWNQNDRANEYQGNIELLTKNCLTYLQQ